MTRPLSIKSTVTLASDAEIRAVLTPAIAADTKRRAEAVAAKARLLAPKRSGALAGSIKVVQARDLGGRFAAGWEVTTDAPYALYVHQGTKPHVIKGRPLLAFFWARTNRMMVLPQVNHPGTRANPFLNNAITEAGK